MGSIRDFGGPGSIHSPSLFQLYLLRSVFVLFEMEMATLVPTTTSGLLSNSLSDTQTDIMKLGLGLRVDLDLNLGLK